MISMELQPAAMQQHLNHGHQNHHGDLNSYQHQITNMNNTSNSDDKNKSKCQVHDGENISIFSNFQFF